MRVSTSRKVNSDLRSGRKIRSAKRVGGWIPPCETTLGKVLIGIFCAVIISGFIGVLAIPFIKAVLAANSENTSTTSVNAVTTSSTSVLTTIVTTTASICTPFWTMPTNDQGTNLTYINANTQISGKQSRSGCVLVRANAVNVDNIVFAIGSNRTSWFTPSGCNEHFALAIVDSSHVTVYGMCGAYDNGNIGLGHSILYDGNFHQLCVTYDNADLNLCVYLDLYSPTCLNRTNPAYDTGSGDVRIGWWPDGNREFVASGGGLIKSMKLFNTAINQTCVTYQYQINFSG